jgi:hypothetical protein
MKNIHNNKFDNVDAAIDYALDWNATLSKEDGIWVANYGTKKFALNTFDNYLQWLVK